MRPSAAGLLSRLACARAMSAGIDVAPLMVKAAVTRKQVEDDSVRLAVKGQIKFVELVADALHDDLLGFHLGCDYDLREIGLLYYVWNSSKLLGDAFRRAERYSSIVNEAVCLRVRSNGNDLALTSTYVGIKRLSDRHQIEFWVTSLVRICRQLTNRHLLPSCVRLVHRRNGGATQLPRQRPARERDPLRVGTGTGHRDHLTALLAGDPAGTPPPIVRVQRRHPTLVELVDHLAHVRPVGHPHRRDLRHRVPDVGCQQDRRALTCGEVLGVLRPALERAAPPRARAT